MGGRLSGGRVLAHLDQRAVAALHHHSVDREGPVLDVVVVEAPVERLRVRVSDVNPAVDVVVEVGMVDAVDRPDDLQVLGQDARNLGTEGVVDVPKLGVPQNQGVFHVRSHVVDPFPEVDAVESLAVGLVVLEAHERQGPDVDLAPLAVGLQHRHLQIHLARPRGFEAIAVAVVLAGNVAREGIQIVGPPEP